MLFAHYLNGYMLKKVNKNLKREDNKDAYKLNNCFVGFFLNVMQVWLSTTRINPRHLKLFLRNMQKRNAQCWYPDNKFIYIHSVGD